MQNRSYKIKSINSSVTLLVMNLVFFAFALQNQFFQLLALFVLVLFIFNYASLFYSISSHEKIILQIFITFLALWLPISFLRNPAALFHFLVVISSLLAAFLITRNLKIYFLASRIILFSVLGIILLYLLNSGLDEFPLEDLIPGQSSNGVTSYLLVALINYAIAKYAVCRSSSIFVSFLTLVICYIGYGRASLIVGLLVLFANLLLFLGKKYLIFLICFALVFSRELYLIYAVDIEFLVYSTKLGAGLYDQHRELQISDYMSAINPVTLITGASYAGTSIESLYNGNPHNSYIRAHNIFGLVYLVSILVLPFLLISFRVFSSRIVFPLGLLLLLFLRAATETIIFPTLFDLFYFSICFILRNLSARSAFKS